MTEHPETLERLLPSSPPLHAAAGKLAATHANVLITGAYGSEQVRQSVARWIHTHGPSPTAPFVSIDCAAPLEAIESRCPVAFDMSAPPGRPQRGSTETLEMAGPDPQRGAASRAVRFAPAATLKTFRILPATPALPGLGACSHPLDTLLECARGLCRRACGATIFLDNLSRLPSTVHASLGRVLASSRDNCVGPARFIVSDTDALIRSVHDGHFPRRLFQLFADDRLAIPPLRQRRQDIPFLATYLVQEACRVRRLPPKSLSDAALTLLGALPWAGDVRELETMAERLAAAPHPTIVQEDVLRHVNFETVSVMMRKRETLREACLRFEREYVVTTLRRHHGRMDSAAKELGIRRPNLYRKTAQLGITLEHHKTRKTTS